VGKLYSFLQRLLVALVHPMEGSHSISSPSECLSGAVHNHPILHLFFILNFNLSYC
jgi:hypothetical protein